jgi:HPt (histidine-containing phosphotransfer) domain-containing protein
MTSTPDLDPEAIERLKRLGGGGFLAKMVDLFLQYGSEKLAEAQQARDSGNMDGLAKAVHPLKSSAGNVGATRLQQLATEAEQKACEGDADAAGSLLDEIVTAFETVKPLLEAERDKEKPDGEVA